MSTFNFDEVVEQCHLALGEFVKGNPEPMKMMFSHREDVTLANPLGPPVEQTKAKLGRRQDVAPFTLRVTMIFRPEDGTWKVVHRHADPITTAQPAESVLQK